MRDKDSTYVPLVRMYAVREKKLQYNGKSVDSPEKVVELAKQILENADREYLLVLSIDNQYRPVAMEIVSIGTIDYAIAEPREILKHALITNASGLILVHNHPGGKCIPSSYDIKITERIKKAGNFLGIKVQNHVIVGNGYFSFAESGMM